MSKVRIGSLSIMMIIMILASVFAVTQLDASLVYADEAADSDLSSGQFIVLSTQENTVKAENTELLAEKGMMWDELLRQTAPEVLKDLSQDTLYHLSLSGVLWKPTTADFFTNCQDVEVRWTYTNNELVDILWIEFDTQDEDIEPLTFTTTACKLLVDDDCPGVHMAIKSDEWGRPVIARISERVEATVATSSHYLTTLSNEAPVEQQKVVSTELNIKSGGTKYAYARGWYTTALWPYWWIPAPMLTSARTQQYFFYDGNNVTSVYDQSVYCEWMYGTWDLLNAGCWNEGPSLPATYHSTSGSGEFWNTPFHLNRHTIMPWSTAYGNGACGGFVNWYGSNIGTKHTEFWTS